MSPLKNALQTGVNLGGWLSQYRAYDETHFASFITESDFQRIADWGCDHVRLPVDYPVLEIEDQPGVPNERGLEFVQNAFDWARKYGLNLIFDLHKAPGYIFDNYQAATLFDDPTQQERFLDLWTWLAQRYLGSSNRVAFELLNEIVLPDSRPWNELVRKAVARIRAVDPDRLIVYGGNYYNSARELANLVVLDDPNILYTFHYYEPLVVTHQKAWWAAGVVDYDREVEYPGAAAGLDEFLSGRPEFMPVLGASAGRRLDRSVLLEYLQPALDFVARTGQPVYCGEYGVIETASRATQQNWNRDFVSLLRENRIGRAVWSYKAMDFGLVDSTGQIVDPELVKIVCAH